MSYKFYTTCVEFPGNVDDLNEMINDAIDISRTCFLKHVDREQLQVEESNCGYTKHHTQGLTMAADWHVSYHRSKLKGKRVYYFCWSAIEHIFTQNQ